MGSAARTVKRTCPRCERSFDTDAAFCPHDGAELDTSPDDPDSDRYIGTTIGSDIEIRSVAGAGAMGRVYRGHQRGTDRDVAVKILHRELSGNLPLVQRFHREGKIASKLQHPHVVDVYLAGQLPDGALYIAMEFLDGLSLAAALTASGGVVPVERAIPIVLQICDAVGEGHARGIVHRDLKPENVMLVRRAETADWVKVLDFGIAKVNLGEQSMQTAAGMIFGTARYISPEGAQGARVTPAGDVYSIAVILYQLLAGHTPFEAEQAVGLLIKHIHDAPPQLQAWPAARKVPNAIAHVVMENLAKEPHRRAPNARALGNALAAAAKEAHISFSDVGVMARLAIAEVPTARQPDLSTPALEPTLDDRESGISLPHEAAPTKAAPFAHPTPLAPPVSVRRLEPDPTHPEMVAAAKPESLPPRPRKRSPVVVVLAFLLGVTLTIVVMQQFGRRTDAEHEEYVQRTRLALAQGQYVEPPGDNVRELVTGGFQRWPNDPELLKIKSDAAHELVTRAMAARSGGDVVGARELAKTAHDFDPTDGSAKLLLAQYEDEIVASADDAGGLLAEPRVALDVPTAGLRAGARVELVARLFLGMSRRKIASPQFTVTGPGLPNGITLPATGAGPYRAVFTAPREGAFDIEFEANVDGAVVRAARTLTVKR